MKRKKSEREEVEKKTRLRKEKENYEKEENIKQKKVISKEKEEMACSPKRERKQNLFEL